MAPRPDHASPTGDLPDHRPAAMLVMGDAAGGVRKHVFDIIRGLSASFRFVLVHSDGLTDATFIDEIDGIRTLLGADAILALPITKRPGVTDVGNLARVLAFARRHRVRIVHGHGAKGGAYARLVAAAVSGARSVYTPHGGSVHAMHGGFLDRIYAGAERALYPLTDFLVFESSYTRDGYHHRLGLPVDPERSLVNFNGVSPEPLHDPGLSASLLATAQQERFGPEICCIGQLRRIKGQRFLVEAWRAVVAAMPGSRLHLIGDGEDMPVLEAMIREAGLGKAVIFHGDLPAARRVLAGFDLCVIPSLFESFGYVAVEAACEGVPLIASRTGGLVEVVIHGETGLLVEPGDPVALSRAIVDSLLHRDAALTRACAARARARRLFSLEAMLTGICRVYAGLVHGPAQGSTR